MAERVVTLLLNYRSAALTLDCLRRLRAATGIANPVLLMDNGSGAEEQALLTAGVAGDPTVELRCSDTNLGYCAAMNRGLEWARQREAEFVLFLNNDVQVEEGCVETLVAVLGNDPDLAAVGPTVLRPDGRVWCQGARLGFYPNLNQLLGEGRVPAPRSAGPETVDYLPGACALYRVADLQAVGGLDESYFMYFEDALIGHQLSGRGRRMVWLPWVRVVHDPSRSSGGGRSPLRKYMTAVNSLRFLRRHFQLRLLAAFCIFDCLGLPLAYLSGGWRAGWAKTVGMVHGMSGRKVRAADVTRWLSP